MWRRGVRDSNSWPPSQAFGESAGRGRLPHTAAPIRPPDAHPPRLQARVSAGRCRERAAGVAEHRARGLLPHPNQEPRTSRWWRLRRTAEQAQGMLPRPPAGPVREAAVRPRGPTGLPQLRGLRAAADRCVGRHRRGAGIGAEDGVRGGCQVLGPTAGVRRDGRLQTSAKRRLGLSCARYLVCLAGGGGGGLILWWLCPQAGLRELIKTWGCVLHVCL